jgi:single-stranded-DNA-specific exonuclease
MSTAAVPAYAPPRARWVPPEPVDPVAVDRIEDALTIPRALCELLVRRGYGEVDAAKAFLRPGRDQIHGPFGLAGMVQGAERVAAAIRAGETILVHGDYDVDGICSTALLCRAFAMMGGRAVPFVPDRLGDGYDLTTAGINAAARVGATLIVTVDCGIVAHAAVEDAARRGIDVVVTDHHTPGDTLPPALAVINPNRDDCAYPGKGLAGVGVAYKLAVAVASLTGLAEERLHALLDLVAVATIADLAPVTGENRAILRWGMAVLARTPNPGMRALLRATRLAEKDEVTTGQVGFVLAPRLNAAGRMGDAMRGVRLLLTDDPAEAERLAGELEVENRRRRDLDEATLEDALRMLDRDYDPARDRGVVLASPDWHPGIIGIVASRVVERIHRPTVLIALGADEGKGSARSIRGFHLQQAFVECSRHLLRFGGHRAAAGCSLLGSEVDAFRESFNEVAGARLTEEQLQPRIDLDAEISLADATWDTVRMLRHFAPFGIGNPTPVLAARSVRLAAPPRILNGGHLKLMLSGDDATLPAIGFRMGDRLAEIGAVGSRVDVAFKLEENTWVGRNGPRVDIQARLVDIRAAS